MVNRQIKLSKIHMKFTRTKISWEPCIIHDVVVDLVILAGSNQAMKLFLELHLNNVGHRTNYHN